MPKSKKKKNRDFQKVKLKVGKEKRGGIEVNTSFTTRTIKITQTLKDFSTASQQPHTKNKLTFEDLLQRCSANKSRSQRLAAVEGLRELVMGINSETHPLFWNARFSPLMSKLGFLFSDPEPVVRQEVLRLCQTVFPQINEQCLSLDYFSAQLVCAMSHVSDDVRRDSLVLFDILLDKCPGKLTGEYCRLVPALINQVCTYMRPGSVGAKLMSPSHGALASQPWRVQVLARLTKIVDVYVARFRADQDTLCGGQGAEVYHAGHLPVVRPDVVAPQWRREWTTWPKSRPGGVRMQEYGYLARDAGQLQQFVSAMLPVLKECWREEFSAQDTAATCHATSDRPLTQASLPALQTVVGLLHSIAQCWRCTRLHDPHSQNSGWFGTEFVREVRETVMPHFPLTITERANKGRKGQQSAPPLTPAALQTCMLKLNLKVCEVLASFPPSEHVGPSGGNKEPAPWQRDVLVFMLENLQSLLTGQLRTQACSTLRHIFFHFPFSAKLGKLLTKTQKRFIKAHALSAEKMALLDLLHEVAFDPHYDSPYHPRWVEEGGRHELLSPFLHHLPQLLLALCGMDNTHRVADRATSCLLVRHSQPLTDAMLQHMPQLLDGETGVFARLSQSCHDNLLTAVRSVYSDRPVPECVLKQLELVIRHGNVDTRTAHRLFACFNSKLSEMVAKARALNPDIRQLWEDAQKYYLRFNLSVFVGARRVELEALQQAHTSETGGLTRVLWSCDPDLFLKHRRLTAQGGQYFKWCVRSSKPGDSLAVEVHTLDVMAHIWTKRILKEYHALSVLTVCGILSHWLYMLRSLTSCHPHVHSLLLHAVLVNCPDDDTTPLLSERDERGTTERMEKELQPVFTCESSELEERVKKELVPVFTTHLPVFTKLTFSLLYSMVAMETGREEGAKVEEGVVGEMWGLVLRLMETSFVIMLHVIQSATRFVQDNPSEQEVMRVTMVMTKLLAAKTLDAHTMHYRHLLAPRLHHYTAAAKAALPQVETLGWWRDFANACHSSTM